MQANDVVIASPIQSIGLQAENIPPPNDIKMQDINQPNMIGIKRSAEEYRIGVISRRQSANTNITVEDIESAENFRMSAHIASLIPNFIAPIQQVAMDNMATRLIESFNTRFNAIDTRLSAIDTRLSAIDTRLSLAEARAFNISATHNDDKLQIPEVGIGNTEGFPTTLGELKTLPINNQVNSLCYRIENYFSIPHNGNSTARRKRIQRAYGIGYTSAQLV